MPGSPGLSLTCWCLVEAIILGEVEGQLGESFKSGDGLDDGVETFLVEVAEGGDSESELREVRHPTEGLPQFEKGATSDVLSAVCEPNYSRILKVREVRVLGSPSKRISRASSVRLRLLHVAYCTLRSRYGSISAG